MVKNNLIVEAIYEDKYSDAGNLLKETLDRLLEQKLVEAKKAIATTWFGLFDESVKSTNVRKIGRIKLIRIRIRNGKVQRRKKFSAVKGYTIRHGHLQRMSTMERLHRRRGAKRAKIKRRAEKSRIRMKTRRSMRRRHSLGL